MNPVIRAQLREFSKANGIAGYSPDTQFEIYSIFSVLNGLLEAVWKIGAGIPFWREV